MSTHNIGFYEDLTKIIFELSSNIMKYAPYFFCWKNKQTIMLTRLCNHDPFSPTSIVYSKTGEVRVCIFFLFLL